MALWHLGRTHHNKIQKWFDVIAQNAGRVRWLERGKPPAKEPKIEKGLRDSNKVPDDLALEVLIRDSFHCRYCLVPIIHADEVRKIQELVGPANLPTSRSNYVAHGTLRAFYCSFDHVLPVSRGGRNEIRNVVTACYPCNFGKDSFTLEQLGLDSPLDSPIIADGHDGYRGLLADS